MKTIFGFLVTLILIGAEPVRADEIFVQSQAVQTVVIPESVSFFAASNQVAFITNRVLTHGFISGDVLLVEPVVVAQRQPVRLRRSVVRQRTVIR